MFGILGPIRSEGEHAGQGDQPAAFVRAVTTVFVGTPAAAALTHTSIQRWPFANFRKRFGHSPASLRNQFSIVRGSYFVREPALYALSKATPPFFRTTSASFSRSSLAASHTLGRARARRLDRPHPSRKMPHDGMFLVTLVRARTQ